MSNNISPEPSPSRYGAHFVCIFETKDEALAYRKLLSKERRQGAKWRPETYWSGVRHKTTARRIKVDGAVVTVYCVTERRIDAVYVAPHPASDRCDLCGQDDSPIVIEGRETACAACVEIGALR